MNDAPSKSDLFYDPDFIAFITLVGMLLIVFGVICFFANTYEPLETDYFVLGILIFTVTAVRTRGTYLIFSAKTKWVSISLVPITMELVFGLYVLFNPNPTFTDMRLPASFFIFVCAMIHFFYAYFMKIQGLSSFSFAIGLVQFLIAALIYFNRPYPELWTPWVLIGVEFLAIGSMAIWVAYYSLNDVLSGRYTLEKE